MPDTTEKAAVSDLTSAHRLVYLESMRGIAAIVVVIAHILGAISLQGLPAMVILRALDTPMAVFINGRAAVIFFFTLSGYVLVLRGIGTRDISLIVKGTIKRWPRLAGPVVCTTIFSSILWTSGLYFHSQMADITGNIWMLHFAFSIPDLSAIPSMGLLAAIETGTILTFTAGDLRFNSALWTMTYEFYGSFAIFLTGALLVLFRWRWLQIYIVLAIFGFMASVSLFYVPFGAGLLLATLHLNGLLRFPSPVVLGLIALALYMFGYREEAAIYHWLHWGSSVSDTVTVVWSLSSFALIAAVTTQPSIRLRLSGPAGEILGKLSFPLYLVHLPVLLSAGCKVYVLVVGQMGTNLASLTMAIVTVIGALIVASLLMVFDRRWVGMLNQLIDRAQLLPLEILRVIRPGRLLRKTIL